MHSRWAKSAAIASLLGTLFLSGCRLSPSVSVLGSFFPVWIFCIVAGILMTIAVRLVLVRYNLESEVGPRIVVYPCVAVFCAFSLWLLFFL